MKISAVATVASLVVLSLAGCASTFNATYDHDPSQNFASYRTFSWIGPNPLMAATNRTVNPLLERRLMSTTQQTLEARGYSFVTNVAAADFVMSFTVGARDKIRVTTYPSGYGAGHRGWGWGGGYYGTQVDARQYTEGTLAIDIFDTATKRPVWHGVATKSISKKDIENMTETVNAAVTAVLGGFPPP